MAGKTILNEDVIRAAVMMLKLGGNHKMAAEAIGVHPDTYKGWRRQGRIDIEEGNNDTIYARLETEIQKAWKLRVVTLLQHAERIMKGNSMASERMVEFMLGRGEIGEFYRDPSRPMIEPGTAVRVTSVEFVALPPPPEIEITIPDEDGTD